MIEQMSDAARRIWERLQKRKAAYRAVFLVDGRPGPLASVVLADLRRFTQYDKGGLVVSPISRMSDPIATAYRAGMRDVLTRIHLMTGLDGRVEDDDERADAADQ